MKTIGIIGDLHGLPISNNLLRWIEVSEPDFLLQVGDIWNCATIEWPAPFYFIPGNHERKDLVQTIHPKNTMLAAGLHCIQGVKVCALPSQESGLFSTKAPFSGVDYEICKSVTGEVDVFISHGCGFPLWKFVDGVRINCEDTDLTELLLHMKPKYAVSGHNHEYERRVEQGVILLRMGAERGKVYDIVEVQ